MIARPHTDGHIHVVVVADVSALGGVEDHAGGLPVLLSVAAGTGSIGLHGEGDIAVVQLGDQSAVVVGGIAPVVRPLDHAVRGEELVLDRQLQAVGEGVGDVVALATSLSLQLREGNAVVLEGGRGHEGGLDGGGAVGVHEVAQGLAGGLGAADALHLARVVAVVRALLLALARVDEGVEGIALGVGAGEHDVAGDQLLDGGDLLKAVVNAPVGQTGAGHALAVLDGLGHVAALEVDPVHQTVTAHGLGVVVEDGIDGGVTVHELTVADVVADLLGVVQDGGGYLAVGSVEQMPQLVGDDSAVDGVLVGHGAGGGVIVMLKDACRGKTDLEAAHSMYLLCLFRSVNQRSLRSRYCSSR